MATPANLPPGAEVILSATDVRLSVEAVASRIAPTIDDEAVVVCLLTGAMWFCADLMTAGFAQKPWPSPERIAPYFLAWAAPARFLIGYGMDAAGRYRGLGEVAALG